MKNSICDKITHNFSFEHTENFTEKIVAPVIFQMSTFTVPKHYFFVVSIDFIRKINNVYVVD